MMTTIQLLGKVGWGNLSVAQPYIQTFLDLYGLQWGKGNNFPFSSKTMIYLPNILCASLAWVNVEWIGLGSSEKFLHIGFISMSYKILALWNIAFAGEKVL